MHGRRLLYVTAAVCVASLGDVATTWYGLEYAGLFEANPGTRHVLDTYGYVGMMIGKAIPATTAVVLSWLSRHLWADGESWKWYAPAIAVIVLNGLVTAYNGLLILSA